MKDKETFKKMIVLLCEKYKQEISIAMVSMIEETLAPYSNKESITAITHVLRYGKFFTSLMPDLMAQLETPREDKALNEAYKVIAQLKSHKITEAFFSKDVITMHLMTNVWFFPTWSRTVLDAELKWFVKEFVEAYLATNADKILTLSIIKQQKQITTKAVSMPPETKTLSVFEKQKLEMIEHKKKEQEYRDNTSTRQPYKRRARHKEIDLEQLTKSI